MLIAGLASVTFRRLAAEEIVELAHAAGLGAVEWGGDVHVPAGRTDVAEQVRRRTLLAGLGIAAYGSYYKAGHSDPEEFTAVLDTAAALGAPRVRVWAGVLGSEQADEPYRRRVAADLARCAGLAAGRGMAVSPEYHVESLTDDLGSALDLYAAVASPALAGHWQPRESPDTAACLREIEALLPNLAAVHVFSWGDDGFTDRLPLADRADLWLPALKLLAADGRDRHATLEFVPDDDPEALLRDAAALREWIAAAG
ncbi:sugar phosphate isomerase/epimerase family protein [Marinitenerispora sediminis]|uniref:Xylose isomerase n=1 Tax=Marinitenerispora sediminis TaxID=1931232 RepID=A0A368T0V5_9ACTN|nr:TIM barrel protein [Marinitenerispora sediminis]RCV48963.1 xylose isomerase [Marinitenerispora sediminis]RCV52946.1 xylose isomerase [Marinitenerispora sediminis]RCV53734.1 xylose isomerase [Marinitenerispora sediminis]